MPTLLRKPIARRLPSGLVVEIRPEGVALRRVRGRRRLVVSWEQIASLASEDSAEAIPRATETAAGLRFIKSLYEPAKRARRPRPGNGST